MTLRTRITLVSGGAVLLAVVAVSFAVYVIERTNLYNQIDNSLSHTAPTVGSAVDHRPSGELSPDHDVFRQVVDRNGEIVKMLGEQALPVTAEVVAVARGERAETYYDDEAVDGSPVRVYATKAGSGGALQIGRSLTEVEQGLRQLMWALIGISVAAVGIALLLGRLVAAAATGPVHRVADAAVTVARTGDLTHHLAVPSGDDLGRLVTSFNSMLDALSDSLDRQRQLVADASHELRTPLATVRTNVEVLARSDELQPGDRAALIRDTVAEISELTRLVEDLVELARGEGQEEPFTTIDLGQLTRDAVGAAKRAHPAVEFSVDAGPGRIRGAPTRISRAISNLLANAAKWNPPGQEVEVVVREGEITVRDHGPGIDAVDIPYVFERFYRSARARSLPGSGLGLAIVKQVADSHGATVTVATAPDGGAVFTLRFPT